MVKSNNTTIEKLNKSWLGFTIIKLFTIQIRNLIHAKLYISREYHIPPSEIDRMQYWEYEWYLDDINNNIKEQEKQNKEDEKKYKGMESSMNPNSMMRNMQSSMPKISTPSFNMPKI